MEWHAGWLTVAVVGSEKGRPKLGRGLCARLPEGTDPEDAQAVGQWAAEQLRQAGIGTRQVAWVAGRGDVLLKRLSLPKPPSENQLPAMVRLQMSRAMPVQGGDAATDYVLLGEADGKLDLLGASVPADRLAWMRRMLSAAKLKLASVVLRAQCSACLAGLPEAGHARIVVSPGAASVEVVVIEPGGVVTSRGIDATWPLGDQEGFVRRIAVEVKRTWMGYRAAPNSLSVESAIVLGGSPLCSSIAQAVAEVIEVDASALSLQAVGGDGAGDSADNARWLPLAGVGVTACDRADLLSPKRAVATRSKTRERALLGAMAAIAVIGGVAVFGYIRLGDLQSELDGVRTQEARLRGEYSDLVLMKSRLEHLEALRESRPEWSAHLERVLGHTAVEGVRIEQLGGVSRGGVWFGDPGGDRSFSFQEGEYRPAVRAELTVQGVGAQRELAGMVRGRLVNDPLYVVQTQGPDAGVGFKLDIETDRRTVPVDEDAQLSATQADEGGVP